MGFFTRIVKAIKWAMAFFKDWRTPVVSVIELLVLVAEGSDLPGRDKKVLVKSAVRELLPRLIKKFGLPAHLGAEQVLSWVDATIEATVFHWNEIGWPGSGGAKDE